MKENEIVVRTERHTYKIVRNFPSEETDSGKTDGDYDYTLQQYGSEIAEEEMTDTRPHGVLHLDKGEIESLTGAELPTYPRCECGNPVDTRGGECLECRHGVEL